MYAPALKLKNVIHEIQSRISLYKRWWDESPCRESKRNVQLHMSRIRFTCEGNDDAKFTNRSWEEMVVRHMVGKALIRSGNVGPYTSGVRSCT